MAITTVPKRIVDLLKAEDIDTIFGIPDPSLFEMFIEAESRGMRVVAPHHEQAGALMADAYYRMTGKPGILGVNKGPGVANIAAGAAYLMKENVPAVFIMGQRHRFYEQRVRRGKMQYYSQRSLFEGSMKYIGIIEYAEQVDDVLHEAFRQALGGVPGPVYVELPMNVMSWQLDFPPAPSPDRYRLVHQRASDHAVAEAAGMLESAQLPILLVGQGALVSRAHGAVVDLARKLACPIIQTSAVEAVLEGMDDCTFPYGSETATEIVGKSDVVVAIGTEIGETLHYGRGHHWSQGNIDRKWIYIERDPMAIGVNRPIDVPLVGDLRDVLPQLVETLKSERSAHGEAAGWAEAHRASKKKLFQSAPKGSSPVHPAELTIEATRVLPKDTVFIRDGGASSLYFSAFLQYNPRDAMWNSNYGAVGPGLPYAIGAQLAIGPSRRVVLLSGDSSILFHISELETAARLNLPLICIVAVDNAWGIEVASYRASYGEDTPTPGARWGTQVRLDKTAESFGAYGEFVERAEDLAPAVERALASGKPSLIHVVVDKEVTGHLGGLPGFAEFRTWYGEDGDALGAPPPSPKAGSEDENSTRGSGY